MKKLALLFATGLVMGTQAFGSVNSDSPKPNEKEVKIGVTDAYIPSGFDTDSDVFVIVNGLYPNGCYRWNRADVTKVENERVLEIQPIASVAQGMCLMVIVPFTNEVQLGKLSQGDHTLRFMSGDGTYLEKSITIE